jgi:hypothetical protein
MAMRRIFFKNSPHCHSFLAADVFKFRFRFITFAKNKDIFQLRES